MGRQGATQVTSSPNILVVCDHRRNPCISCVDPISDLIRRKKDSPYLAIDNGPSEHHQLMFLVFMLVILFGSYCLKIYTAPLPTETTGANHGIGSPSR